VFINWFGFLIFGRDPFPEKNQEKRQAMRYNLFLFKEKRKRIFTTIPHATSK